MQWQKYRIFLNCHSFFIDISSLLLAVVVHHVRWYLVRKQNVFFEILLRAIPAYHSALFKILTQNDRPYLFLVKTLMFIIAGNYPFSVFHTFLYFNRFCFILWLRYVHVWIKWKRSNCGLILLFKRIQTNRLCRLLKRLNSLLIAPSPWRTGLWICPLS